MHRQTVVIFSAWREALRASRRTLPRCGGYSGASALIVGFDPAISACPLIAALIIKNPCFRFTKTSLCAKAEIGEIFFRRIVVRQRPAPSSVVNCVISRTRMEAKGKIANPGSRRRRWTLPNGTELLRHRRLVGAGRRLTCVGAKSRLAPGLAPHSFRQSGFARLSITRGFRSTPFR